MANQHLNPVAGVFQPEDETRQHEDNTAQPRLNPRATPFRPPAADANVQNIATNPVYNPAAPAFQRTQPLGPMNAPEGVGAASPSDSGREAGLSQVESSNSTPYSVITSYNDVPLGDQNQAFEEHEDSMTDWAARRGELLRPRARDSSHPGPANAFAQINTPGPNSPAESATSEPQRPQPIRYYAWNRRNNVVQDSDRIFDAARPEDQDSPLTASEMEYAEARLLPQGLLADNEQIRGGPSSNPNGHASTNEGPSRPAIKDLNVGAPVQYSMVGNGRRLRKRHWIVHVSPHSEFYIECATLPQGHTWIGPVTLSQLNETDLPWGGTLRMCNRKAKRGRGAPRCLTWFPLAQVWLGEYPELTWHKAHQHDILEECPRQESIKERNVLCFLDIRCTNLHCALCWWWRRGAQAWHIEPSNLARNCPDANCLVCSRRAALRPRGPPVGYAASVTAGEPNSLSAGAGIQQHRAIGNFPASTMSPGESPTDAQGSGQPGEETSADVQASEQSNGATVNALRHDSLGSIDACNSRLCGRNGCSGWMGPIPGLGVKCVDLDWDKLRRDKLG